VLRAAAGFAVLVTVVLPAATIARGAWEAPRRIAAHLPPPPSRSMRELPAVRERELLAVEDPRFFDHHGVDLRTPGAGWTTITQALVKVLYFESFRPGPRAKLEQTLLAIGFDAAVGKREQLDLFFNLAYLGRYGNEDVVGFPRASAVYFGRDVTALDRPQYLALVAMLIAPNHYSPARHPDVNAERRTRIERLLEGKCHAASWRDVELAACGEAR
jgi:membrane peptidoglycan carboxypeptidase